MDTVVIIKLKEFRRIRREFLESDQIAHLLYGEFNEYSESFDLADKEPLVFVLEPGRDCADLLFVFEHCGYKSIFEFKLDIPSGQLSIEVQTEVDGVRGEYKSQYPLYLSYDLEISKVARTSPIEVQSTINAEPAKITLLSIARSPK